MTTSTAPSSSPSPLPSPCPLPPPPPWPSPWQARVERELAALKQKADEAREQAESLNREASAMPHGLEREAIMFRAALLYEREFQLNEQARDWAHVEAK